MKSNEQQKTSLRALADKVIIIIDPEEKKPLIAQKEWLKACMTSVINCSTLGYFRASIIHDQDKHPNGEPKLIHMHAFLQSHEKQTLKEWLTTICEVTGAKKEQVSIDLTNNEYLQVQYLRHDRKEEKAKYDASLILTNDSEELTKRLNTEYVKPIDPVEEALKSCDTLTEFMANTDYLTANKFRGLFKDLHSERSIIADYHKLQTDYIALKKFLTDLMATLRLTLKDNSCRLDNWRYWSEWADKLDLYL